MKPIPIEERNLIEIADELESLIPWRVRERLRAIHDLTRWIPVSERMPDATDADKQGQVLKWDALSETPLADFWDNYHTIGIAITHWKRITPPEDKP